MAEELDPCQWTSSAAVGTYEFGQHGQGAGPEFVCVGVGQGNLNRPSMSSANSTDE